MNKYDGKTGTVVEYNIDSDGGIYYKLSIDGEKYSYDHKWLHGVKENDQN